MRVRTESMYVNGNNYNGKNLNKIRSEIKFFYQLLNFHWQSFGGAGSVNQSTRNHYLKPSNGNIRVEYFELFKREFFHNRF